MTFPNVKPGGYVSPEVLPPEHATAFALNISRAVDGHDGGTYSPLSPIAIEGAGLRVASAPSDAADVTNKDYVDERDDLYEQAVCATLGITSGATTAGNTMPVTLVGSYYRDTSWTLSSNELQVPEPGVYLVHLQALAVVTTSTSRGDISIVCGGSAVATATGILDASDNSRISGQVVVPITTPSASKFSLQVASTQININATIASASRLIVMRLGTA